MGDSFSFSKQKIDALPVPEKGRAYYRDTKLNGLVLQITAAGTRSFQVYKKVGVSPIRVTLGKFPGMPVALARKKAAEVLAEMATGANPNSRKKRRRMEAVTLGRAFEDYLKARPGLKKTTRRDMRVAFESMLDDWLAKPIASITRDMVEKRHRSFGKNRSEARANLGMRYLRAVMNFAIDRYQDSEGEPIVRENPVAVLKRGWFRVERRRTVIKPHELKPWWTAVEALPNQCAADYFRLLLLTGLRREEGLGLTWDCIDFKARTLTVRDPKNRNDHTLPFTDYIEEIIERRRAESTSELVFSTARGKLANLRYALESVKKSSGVDFTPHDLRRTFATIADSLDIPGYAVKALLNHRAGADVTAGYVIVTPERLRDPMRKITDFVLKAAGRKEGAEVIHLRLEAEQG